MTKQDRIIEKQKELIDFLIQSIEDGFDYRVDTEIVNNCKAQIAALESEPETLTRSKERESDWTVPENDIINVPDELDKLFNAVGMQLRFHTISGKNEALTVAHIVKKADDYFHKLTHPDIKQSDKQ